MPLRLAWAAWARCIRRPTCLNGPVFHVHLRGGGRDREVHVGAGPDEKATSNTPARRIPLARMAATVLLTLIAAVPIAWTLRPVPFGSLPEMRVDVGMPAAASDSTSSALSPDGQQLVFVASGPTRGVFVCGSNPGGASNPFFRAHLEITERLVLQWRDCDVGRVGSQAQETWLRRTPVRERQPSAVLESLDQARAHHCHAYEERGRQGASESDSQGCWHRGMIAHDKPLPSRSGT